ncbi:MAG: TonB family protein [Desulfovibrio sp.]|nr:TonB family protein [Desulfovibrio sp.]
MSKQNLRPLVFRWLWLFGLFWLFCPGKSFAATAVAVDTESGYASEVLSKVLAKWTPPALRGNYSVQVKVSLDGNGHVKNCEAIRPSSIEVFDQVACSAVYAAQPFGKTSYEAPLDIYLAFQLRENAPPSSNLGLSDADALRAEVVARTRVERDLAATMADATEQRARERAQAAARSRGQTLPEVQAAPVDKKPEFTPPKQQKPAPAPKGAEGKRLPANGEHAGPNPAAPAAQTKPVAGKTEPPLDSGQLLALRKEKYTKLLTRSLTRIIFLPKQLPQGSYSVLMKVVVDAKGKILDNAILKSSGNADADKAMLHCVKVARTVPAPPSGLDNSFQVPLTVSK